MQEIAIQLPGTSEPIGGSHPVIIIGPNGSGKTRLGVALSSPGNRTTRVPALRNLELPADIQIGSRLHAKGNLENEYSRTTNAPWVLAKDIVWLLAELVAEDAEAAVKFRDSFTPGDVTRPPQTTMTRLRDFWSRAFPGRTLDVSAYKPEVTSTLSGDMLVYPAMHMSDGERVAIYVAARVLHAPAGLLVIDEPEVHFHSVLARRFWAELEAMRTDCRFVYITHDIPFAVSRRNAQFVIARPNGSHQILAPDTDLPDDVIISVLGAASFSVTARRLIFCEGVPGKDDLLYQAWFGAADAAVIAVAGCAEVAKCVTVIGSGRTVRGVTAIGIIDRDYLPDDVISEFEKDGIHVLPVHEFESLFCLPEVHAAIARHASLADADARYERFLANAKKAFNSVLFNKQILERTRCALDRRIQGWLNAVAPNSDRPTLRESLVSLASASSSVLDPGAVFDAEEARTTSALNSTSTQEFLRIFPGKTMIGHAAQSLEMTAAGMTGLVIRALGADASKEPQFERLQEDLIKALSSSLPSRG